MKPLTVNKAFVRKVLPERKPWSHKGDFGKLLVIGGSRRYSGSPALEALAAYRTGCDLVVVAAPERAANTIASFSPDIITEPLKGDYLNSWHLKSLLELSENADAVVIGGGLGRRKETLSAVVKFLGSVNLPCVIDADAIHAAGEVRDAIKNNFILTPHSHEFFVLSGEKPSQRLSERVKQVQKLASSLDTTILLKGHIDVISSSSRTAINRTGNPCMTKGGTGDTLAGICGAFLAMGIEPFKSACAASYVNGCAGDIAAREFGTSMLASDMIFTLTEVMKELNRKLP